MNKKKWEEIDPKAAFFPVELRPIYMKPTGSSEGQNDLFTADGLVQLQRHKAVVDVEKETAFAVVTDNYELVTNKAAYEQAEEVMKKVFQMTTIDDMACLNVTMPSTRSFCHIDLIHKSADFSPWEQDKWTAFIRVTNSYNRTRRLRFELGFCRWICLNGMIFGSKSIEFSYAHTRRGKDRIERFVENIGDIRKLEASLTEKLHNLERYYVPEKHMLPTLCRAFNIKVTPEVAQKKKRMEELVALREHTRQLTNNYFSEIGPNGYAALNVLTDFASRPEGVISREASINGLQHKASSWMEEFISEIKNSSFSFDNYLADYRETVEIIESL